MNQLSFKTKKNISLIPEKHKDKNLVFDGYNNVNGVLCICHVYNAMKAKVNFQILLELLDFSVEIYYNFRFLHANCTGVSHNNLYYI